MEAAVVVFKELTLRRVLPAAAEPADKQAKSADRAAESAAAESVVKARRDTSWQGPIPTRRRPPRGIHQGRRTNLLGSDLPMSRLSPPPASGDTASTENDADVRPLRPSRLLLRREAGERDA